MENLGPSHDPVLRETTREGDGFSPVSRGVKKDIAEYIDRKEPHEETSKDDIPIRTSDDKLQCSVSR